MLLSPLVAVITLLDLLSISFCRLKMQTVLSDLQLLTPVVVLLGDVLVELGQRLIELVLLLDLIDLFELHKLPFPLVGKVFLAEILIF